MIYFSHAILLGKLENAAIISESICNLKEPQNVRELILFLASVTLSVDSYQTNQPKSLDELTYERKDAVTTPQEHLIFTPFLALPRANGQYIVDTDGCDRQVGAFLLQEEPDRTRGPMRHRSNSLHNPIVCTKQTKTNSRRSLADLALESLS